jgi:hypothetical protein
MAMGFRDLDKIAPVVPISASYSDIGLHPLSLGPSLDPKLQ